jgi:hypothetical protein
MVGRGVALFLADGHRNGPDLYITRYSDPHDS